MIGSHIELARRALAELDKLEGRTFSGFGAAFYTGEPGELPIAPLVTDLGFALPILGLPEIARVLVSISQLQDVRHDGFHLVHEGSELTHICQFFSPPIPTGFRATKYGVGARYRAAELASLHPNVTATVIVAPSRSAYGFRRGVVEVIRSDEG